MSANDPALLACPDCLHPASSHGYPEGCAWSYDLQQAEPPMCGCPANATEPPAREAVMGVPGGVEEARPSRLGTAYMAMFPLFALLMTFALTWNLVAALLAYWAVSMAECLAFIDGRRQQQKASTGGES